MYTTIIASLPGEPMLAETLASVATQSLPAERVLVVCDAGGPLPSPWIEDLRDILPTVEFLRNPLPGQVAAINHGIANATTPYLAFLDADDLWQPEKQRLQVDLLENEAGLDAVNCLAANFRDDGSGQRQQQQPNACITFTSTTFRRVAFDRLGALDPTNTHFTWLYRWWGDARRAGISTRSIDYVGLLRRLHDRNSWSVHQEAAHRDLLSEIRRHARQARTQP